MFGFQEWFVLSGGITTMSPAFVIRPNLLRTRANRIPPWLTLMNLDFELTPLPEASESQALRGSFRGRDPLC